MRQWVRNLLCATVGFVTVMPLFSQTRPNVSVPFVGCESWGQTGDIEAPNGMEQSVAISASDARLIAYYKSEVGTGIIGPRGWHCQGTYGSGGSSLYLSPNPLHHSATAWEHLEGPVIAIRYFDGETSGRFAVAEVALRLFPEYRAFSREVFEGLDLPVPSVTFQSDVMHYRSKTIVEFTTPAQTEGLGNFNSWLNKNELPITGVAILTAGPGRSTGNPIDNPPSLLLLSVRLPPGLARLAPTIIQYCESRAIGTARR